MDFRIVWTAPALEDLETLVRYIAQDDAKAAVRVGDKIVDHVSVLASFPEIGPVYRRRTNHRTGVPGFSVEPQAHAMPTESDIRPMVERYSAMPVERLRVLRSFKDLQLSLIRRGIVFVFAAWSGPAVMALQRFTKVLKTIDTGSLDLVVLDIASLAEDSARQLFGNEGFTTGGGGVRRFGFAMGALLLASLRTLFRRS